MCIRDRRANEQYDFVDEFRRSAARGIDCSRLAVAGDELARGDLAAGGRCAVAPVLAFFGRGDGPAITAIHEKYGAGRRAGTCLLYTSRCV